jgi:hypothetical protein
MLPFHGSVERRAVVACSGLMLTEKHTLKRGATYTFICLTHGEKGLLCVVRAYPLRCEGISLRKAHPPRRSVKGSWREDDADLGYRPSGGKETRSRIGCWKAGAGRPVPVTRKHPLVLWAGFKCGGGPLFRGAAEPGVPLGLLPSDECVADRRNFFDGSPSQ